MRDNGPSRVIIGREFSFFLVANVVFLALIFIPAGILTTILSVNEIFGLKGCLVENSK